MSKVTADIVGDRVYVWTEFRDKERVKLVPGITWDPDDKVWTAPISWATCQVLRGVFGHDLVIGETLTRWARREREMRIDPAMELRAMTDYPEGRKGLYPFQRAGVRFLTIAGDALLADEMGTGKTVQVAVALDELGPDALPALVICPNAVKRNWAREITRWHSVATPYILDGTASARRKKIIAATDDPNAVIIVNIEAVRMFSRLAPYPSVSLRRCSECAPKGVNATVEKFTQCEVHEKELNRVPFKTVIFDEAHRIKEPKSKQTRAAWALMHGKTVQRRWALTGTPIANHPGDLWAIMHGVSPSDFPSKTKFLDRFAQLSWNSFGGLDIVGLNVTTRDEFFRILDPRFRRMPKELVLTQLPPKIRTQRYVQMSLKQRKAYEELAAGMLTRLEDGSLLVTTNNLTTHMRLLQLSSSYAEIIKDDPDDVTTWKVILKDPSPKIDELLAIIDELGGDKQLVVAAESRQLIELTARRLEKEKITYGMITGAVTEAERDYVLQEFQAGRRRVMLFTVKAGGTGLTMTAADTIVFLQRSWSMIDNKQAEDRVHRIGSEHHRVITIIDIVAEDTVEETHQIPRLIEKLDRLEEIVRDRATLEAAGRDVSHLNYEEAQIMNANLFT